MTMTSMRGPSPEASRSTRQADSIAAIALELPEQPTTSDVLRALTRAYKVGCQDTLAQMDKDLIRALADTHRSQELGP